VNRVLADADVRKRIRDLGADPAGNSPEAFARFIRDDQAKWARLSREAGLKLD
jgi:tripartite-type tricarboxylate transporter receptor subunit TctC